MHIHHQFLRILSTYDRVVVELIEFAVERPALIQKVLDMVGLLDVDSIL
jgi:hypothetical protein